MRRVLFAVVAAALFGLAACGVTVQDSPQEVEPPRGPHRALASGIPGVPEPGALRERLYFVRDSGLVPVNRPVRAAPTPETLVRDLIAGPTDSERDAGLSSALSGATVMVAGHTNGRVTIELGPASDDIARSDQVLAYGQLVATLTARPETSSVVFTREGQQVGIPRADGALSRAPLTRADYATLFTED